MKLFLKLLLLLVILFAISCGKSKNNDLTFFEVQDQDFLKYINTENYSDTLDLQNLKTIANPKYPIEIALFKDNTMYYDLPDLKDGTGKWKIENGKIVLTAELPLFDMYIEVWATGENAKTVSLRFADRFGPKVLEMENQNIE